MIECVVEKTKTRLGRTSHHTLAVVFGERPPPPPPPPTPAHLQASSSSLLTPTMSIPMRLHMSCKRACMGSLELPCTHAPSFCTSPRPQHLLPLPLMPHTVVVREVTGACVREVTGACAERHWPETAQRCPCPSCPSCAPDHHTVTVVSITFARISTPCTRRTHARLLQTSSARFPLPPPPTHLFWSLSRRLHIINAMRPCSPLRTVCHDAASDQPIHPYRLCFHSRLESRDMHARHIAR
jgi:hypothetical protein